MRLRNVGRVSPRTRHCRVTEGEDAALTHPTRGSAQNASHWIKML